MSIKFNDWVKDYCVLVKDPKLVGRAEELGWRNFIFFEKDEFDDDEITEIIRMHKNIIKFYFDTKKQSGFRTLGQVKEGLNIYVSSFNPNGFFIDENKNVETMDDVIEFLPKIINHMEIKMIREGLLWITDYSDKCGNCGNYLYENDKYCRACGTERGKGKFEPYKISEAITCGAPRIKRKYKCFSCGHIWVTESQESSFCPQCSKNLIKKIEERTWDRFADIISSNEPYDTERNPIIFTEEQVKKLLSIREEIDDSIRYYSIYSPDKIIKALRNIGLDFPEEIDWENFTLADKQAEQINLARTILYLKGNNLHSYDQFICPFCKSHIIAGIGYHINTRESEILLQGYDSKQIKNALYYDDGAGFCVDSFGKTNKPAYVCLECGQIFGEFTLSAEQLDFYRNANSHTNGNDK